MKILITGADGYLGWPLMISMALEKYFKNSEIVGVDNLLRRKLVKKVKSESAIPISSFLERNIFLKKINNRNKLLNIDLTNFEKIDRLISRYKFDFIINLAAQPSAPYSFADQAKCSFTQNNNNQILRNLIWSIKKNKLEKKTHLIHSTTTGVYGAPKIKIPEGFLNFKGENYPFGFMAGSWYHMSKCNDINNIYLAKRTFGINVSDFRTAIVYGLNYDLYDKKNSRLFNTRFDYDYYFGVVLNRFLAMALTNKTLTIYGKGQQKKPFIPLNDCVKSFINFVKIGKTANSNVFNQYTHLFGIKTLANTIANSNYITKTKIKNIKNPRIEDEGHNMRMHNENFLKILKTKPETLKKTINQTIEILENNNCKFKSFFK